VLAFFASENKKELVVGVIWDFEGIEFLAYVSNQKISEHCLYVI
jgi:hypothetical protein